MGQPSLLRVAIYCRVSTADQSCDRQERELAQHAERGGYCVVGTFKETASGARDDRGERKKIIALAQDRRIDAVLVTELTRWGRSTIDLIHTLQQLQAWNVSVIAQTGFQFDLATPQGKLIASLMAALSEFERDLIRERVRSGMAAAAARGSRPGRRLGQRPKSDRMAPKVMELVGAGQSYRRVAKELQLSKNTVASIVKRSRSPASVSG